MFFMSKTQLKQNSIVGLDCNKNKGIHETMHIFFDTAAFL